MKLYKITFHGNRDVGEFHLQLSSSTQERFQYVQEKRMALMLHLGQGEAPLQVHPTSPGTEGSISGLPETRDPTAEQQVPKS